MSLSANIEHLAAAQGILAVAVEGPNGLRTYRGDPAWRAVMDGSMGLLACASEPMVRLVVGRHTVVVQSEGREKVAVVLPTGHGIAKSLRRMIRRMARKDRGPLRPEDVRQHAAEVRETPSNAA